MSDDFCVYPTEAVTCDRGCREWSGRELATVTLQSLFWLQNVNELPPTFSATELEVR